ncbi:hypothetical protein COS70_05765 [Candidatus Micrarchaeota archaeon CG06_land_8_20_14_3_00_50_6]|nr:MAG: hypothetical protein COS70_05765 [Candidatus Micrarchaeota archaeon CG06_land_8_20_14_3_00_50_6]
MAYAVKERDRKYLEKGGVLANIFIDLHANTKEEVEQLGVAIVANMAKEEGIVYAVGKVLEGIENEGVYSTSGEVRVLAESYPALFAFCVKHAPVGVEIYEPNEIRMPPGEAVRVLLNAIAMVQDYNKIIMEKVMTAEQYQNYLKSLDRKREVGKRLLETLSKKKNGTGVGSNEREADKPG